MGSRERKIILIIALIVAAAVIAAVCIYVSRIPRRGKRGSQPRRIRFRSAGGHRRQRYYQRDLWRRTAPFCATRTGTSPIG